MYLLTLLSSVYICMHVHMSCSRNQHLFIINTLKLTFELKSVSVEKYNFKF